MDAPNLKNQGEPVASPNATQTSQLEVPIINSTSMQARRNRNIIFAVSAVVVFLLVLTTTLLILNSVRSSSNTDSNTSDLDVEQDEDIVVEDEEENVNEEVDDVEEDEDITAETPALTQECKDELKGIKFGMPAGWTCTTSSANFGASSFMLTANSNDANKTQFVLSNLGRGPYCYTVPMGDTNSEPDCTLSEFYKNPNMTITYFNASQGGELFGGVNLKNYESEWISITGNSIGSGKSISESDKNLFIAMLESVHTFTVNSNANANYNVNSYVKNMMDKYNYVELSNFAWKLNVPSTNWTTHNLDNNHGDIGAVMDDKGAVGFSFSTTYPIFAETGTPDSLDEYINFFKEYVLSNYSEEHQALYTKIEKFDIQNYGVAFISPVTDNSNMTPSDTMNLGSSMLIFDYSGKINPRLVSLYATKTYDDSINIAEVQHNLLKYMGEKISLGYKTQ